MVKNKERGEYIVIVIAACLSVLAFLWHFHRGDILLDGDAVAHINVARRVFDSLTPGPLQLGTVWLPLPHILMMPFLVSDWAWRTGAGGSVPSMAAYVFAVLGIFRLVKRGLTALFGPARQTTWAGWVAALLFALNPNMLYLQATAMTESLYLALFVWAVLYFTEFARPDLDNAAPGEKPRELRNCGLCLAAAMLTRYDGWFAAGIIACAAVLVEWRRAAKPAPEAVARHDFTPAMRPLRHVGRFLVIVATVPALWLAYNGLVYGNPLEFATGKYSAHGIAQRSYTAGVVHPPGFHSLGTASLYFLKAVQLDLESLGKLWLATAAVGVVLLLGSGRRLWPWLLLWIPLSFYALSIAYGDAALYVPQWWPFSFYNLRYGVQLIPAIAVFSAGATFFVARALPGKLKMVPAAAVLLVALTSYVPTWREPMCLVEARVNSRLRIDLESKLAEALEGLPRGSTLLMYAGNHSGVLQRADIPLRRVIQEGNHRTWKQPVDPEGLWEKALEDPKCCADYAAGFDEDEVAISARRHGLREVARFEVPGQGSAAVYATGR